jgi:predicted transcriptional regulator of viral defense system
MISGDDKVGGGWISRREARKAVRSLASRFQRLREASVPEHGVVTLALAARFGVSPLALSRYERKGMLHRSGRGLYRFADELPGEGDEIRDVLIEYGSQAVASHETALRLLQLSDVNPGFIHITIPRSKRYVTPRRNVVVHTTSLPMEAHERTMIEGIAVTAPARSIVDAARDGTQWDHIDAAVREAILDGRISKEDLRRALERATRQVREHIESLLKGF